MKKRDFMIWVIPQDPKLLNKLSKHGTVEQLDEKSLTICSGVDYTNITYQHIVLTSAQQAKVKNRNNFVCVFFSELSC